LCSVLYTLGQYVAPGLHLKYQPCRLETPNSLKYQPCRLELLETPDALWPTWASKNLPQFQGAPLHPWVQYVLKESSDLQMLGRPFTFPSVVSPRRCSGRGPCFRAKDSDAARRRQERMGSNFCNAPRTGRPMQLYREIQCYDTSIGVALWYTCGR
jgi:hypothetical protein